MSSRKRHRSLSTSPTPPRKHQRSQSLDSDASFTTNSVNIYIVQAKLDPSAVSELFSLVEAHNNGTTDGDDGFTLESCSDVSCADVIVTAIRMKKRLERHVNWNIAVSLSRIYMLCLHVILYFTEAESYCYSGLAS